MDLSSERNLFTEYELGDVTKGKEYSIRLQSCYDLLIDNQKGSKLITAHCDHDQNRIHVTGWNTYDLLVVDSDSLDRGVEYLPTYLADENSKVVYLNVRLAN